jgi:hypothetical protein
VLKLFISQDTYDLVNKYAFVNGNPIMFQDPSGHKPSDFNPFSVDAWQENWWKPVVVTGAIVGGAIPFVFLLAKLGRAVIRIIKNIRNPMTNTTSDKQDDNNRPQEQSYADNSSVVSSAHNTVTDLKKGIKYLNDLSDWNKGMREKYDRLLQDSSRRDASISSNRELKVSKSLSKVKDLNSSHYQALQYEYVDAPFSRSGFGEETSSLDSESNNALQQEKSHA